jgi:hypothetical protein
LGDRRFRVEARRGVAFVHARGQSLIVLVAEDETIIALDLEDMLTAAG